MNAYFLTLGCKVNQYESEAMLSDLLKHGFDHAESANKADVVVINSCTVTGTSDQKVRQTLRRVRRNNPNAVIVLTGCMTQAFPELSGQMSEADVILGNNNRKQLLPALNEYLSTHMQVVHIEPHRRDTPFEPLRIEQFHERTRAFVKIEDGCDRYCSYCIIPTARGRVRSRTLSDLNSELSCLADAGYREAVLVGINLSAYGKELGYTLCDAVETACSINGLERVRLGSLEPNDLTPSVIERMSKQDKLCPQFHLSLQSGSDRILRSMNRRYTTSEYLFVANNLRKYFSECTLTTDLMVGFPGESEEDFQQSLKFAREVGFEKIHVFAYSKRPGTRAAQMDGQIARAEKERRSRLMMETAADIRSSYLRTLIGKNYPVLFESITSDGLIEGYTPNYISVRVREDNSLCGTIRNTCITEAMDDYCVGTLA